MGRERQRKHAGYIYIYIYIYIILEAQDDAGRTRRGEGLGGRVGGRSTPSACAPSPSRSEAPLSPCPLASSRHPHHPGGGLHPPFSLSSSAYPLPSSPNLPHLSTACESLSGARRTPSPRGPSSASSAPLTARNSARIERHCPPVRGAATARGARRRCCETSRVPQCQCVRRRPEPGRSP